MARMVVDEETARLVVSGELSMMTTALLKTHQSNQAYQQQSSYFYGRNSMRHSTSMPSKISVVSAHDEGNDDEIEELDDGSPASDTNPSQHHHITSSTSHYPQSESHSVEPILKKMMRLKQKLRKGHKCSYSVTSDPSFIIPFCEIVKNKSTDGHLTGAALQSLLKFINYGLVHATESFGSAVLIGDSVTKARFVGNDTSTDEVVLMRILNVLKELIVQGFKSLSNEIICEIMQSSFRITFEKRLSELLRKNAEQALTDMVRCLFLRVNEFDDKVARETSLSISSGPGVKVPSGFGSKRTGSVKLSNGESIGSRPHGLQTGLSSTMEINSSTNEPSPTNESLPSIPPARLETVAEGDQVNVEQPQENKQVQEPSKTKQPKHEPHGIECLLELLSYLTSIVNPLDHNNSEGVINVGLNLLIVAFETSCDAIECKSVLVKVIQTDLTFNLLSLMSTTPRALGSFALALRMSFMIFLRMRKHLKYQMELLLTRLKDIVTTQNAPSEFRELALEYLVSFFKHIPFLPQEIFFNFDLDPYASNLMEELFEFFSKNCFNSSNCPGDPLGSSSSSSNASAFTFIQLLSLDALLANLNSLHRAELMKEACLVYGNACSSSSSPEKTTSERIFPKSLLELIHIKQRKNFLEQATKEFNNKPKEGVKLLQKHSLISDDAGLACFLRDNQNLSKRVMGEFLAKKENAGVLNAFLKTFKFKGLRLDEAMRVYLESFRLPGEAPLVSNIVEPFSVYWQQENDDPFEHPDASYTLAYAIIMLNVDQHNINVKKQNNVMTCDQFINNLRGVNGSKDFDHDMLREIYQAIKSKEIVMPDEHDGPVRDKYLWKCLLERSRTPAGVYVVSKVPSGSHDETPQEEDCVDSYLNTKNHECEGLPLHTLNQMIFTTLWGPTVSAMTFMFDRINVNHNSSLTQRILFNGFNSCALLCSSYGHLDNLIVILCKFTLNSSNTSSSASSMSSGVSSIVGPLLSHKTQLAAQTLFGIMREYANEMRESWSNIVEIILHWFMMGFLDEQLVVDDFALDQKLRLKRTPRKKVTNKTMSDQSSATGIFSSLYSYFAVSNPEIYSDDVESIKSMDSDGKSVGEGKIQETTQQQPDHIINTFCQPLSIIEESKFLHIDSLMELLKAIINVNLELEESEVGDDIEAFKLEMLVQMTLLNRDRVPMFWSQVSNFILRVLRSTAATPSQLLSERAISAIFRLAIRFTPRPDETSDQVLDLLRKVLYTLEPSVIQKQCTAIALSSFIKHCNAYIRRTDDWSLIFDYLLCIGIGCHPSDLPVRHTNSSPTPPASEVTTQVENIIPDMSAVSIQIEDIPDEIPGMTVQPEASNQETAQTGEASPNQSQTPRQSPVKQRHEPPDPSSEPTQPFIPGNSSVRDVEAYKKCVETLTVVIKEILPKNASIQSNPRTDAEINQLAIDSLILLRYYSLHDERLLEGSSKPRPSSPTSSPVKEHS